MVLELTNNWEKPYSCSKCVKNLEKRYLENWLANEKNLVPAPNVSRNLEKKLSWKLTNNWEKPYSCSKCVKNMEKTDLENWHLLGKNTFHAKNVRRDLHKWVIKAKNLLTTEKSLIPAPNLSRNSEKKLLENWPTTEKSLFPATNVSKNLEKTDTH